MSRRRNRPSSLPAPYLKRVWLDPALVAEPGAYPFCLPFLRDGFELRLRSGDHHYRRRERHGEVDAAGRHRRARRLRPGRRRQGLPPADHSLAIETTGGLLAQSLRRPGCRKSPTAGSSGRRASSRSRATSTRPPGSPAAVHRRIFSPTRTARASCASSRNAASARASSSSTSPSRRSRPRARSSS